jgi:regulatory protein
MTPPKYSSSKRSRSSHYKTRKPTPKDIPTDGSASITSLRACSDQPDQLSVRVDRVLMGRIEHTTKIKHKLKVGDAWTEDLALALHTELTRSRAYRSAIRIMSARAKSAEELRRSLLRKDNDPDAIQYAIDRLTELGVLNDREYAGMRARSIIRSKPAGRRFIEAKLREKGIESSIIRETLDEELEDSDPKADALNLARRMHRSLASIDDPEVRKRRLIGRLARRGFDHDAVRSAVEIVEREFENE